MSGGMFLKQSQVVQQSPSYICSLHGSLRARALVILTLLSFIFFSLKSFRFPPQCSSPVPPQVEENRVVVEGGDKGEFSDIYHSPEVFRLNYVEMENKFKVYIYPDGVPNTFYQTPRKLTGKYASEGYFCRTLGRVILLPMIQIRRTSSLFQFLVTRCEAREHPMKMTMIVQKYVESLITKYPYWNRTLGTDHFFVTCRDVGVRVTVGLPFRVKNSIRAVCSPSYDVGFIPHKDVALPQVLQPFALPAGGNDVENRTTLGFWAGHLNSKIRVILA